MENTMNEIHVNGINCRLIRSGRKTLGLEVKPEGVFVRAPHTVSEKQIERFVRDHESWIRKKKAGLEKALNSLPSSGKLSEEEIRELAEKARIIIPERVAYYAPRIGVSYGRITIRNQKTRWGSCSAKGNLNFNCLLMLTPPEVIDSVVVHELCHRREMNHSKKFYAEVLRVFPDYWKWDRWLKDHGPAIMMRNH